MNFTQSYGADVTADKEKVEDSMDTIKKLVEEIPYLQIPKEEPLQDTIEMPHIETDAEIDNSLKEQFKELLAGL